MSKFFLRRVFKNKIYWLAVFSALVLLLCSVIYIDPTSGQRYTIFSVFCVEEIKTLIQYGSISIKDILMGYGAQNYLWMFCPIIVGIPCILTQKLERFALFRSNKNRYFLYRYISNMISGGVIMVMAHLLFVLISVIIIQGINLWIDTSFMQEKIFDFYLVQKLVSVFFQGIVNALPGILLAEFIRNKYLILCIPFVWNYFISMFGRTLFTNEIWSYISPSNYAMLLYLEQPRMITSIVLLIVEILACGFIIKFNVERRCDCGQR